MAHKPACCLNCHLRWVEAELLPALPPHAARSIFLEHESLRDSGASAALIAGQSKRALPWFEIYCSPAKVHSYRVDQVHLMKGKTT